VHSWSWEPATIYLTAPVRDALQHSDHDRGDAVELGPLDVRVFLER